MKKIFIIAVIFAMLTPLVSCGQKTHFKFEKIRNANFREKTQFFAFNDLIYVIDRDKLVCMNPDNGQMLESVNLPGYPTDFSKSLMKTSDVSMIFKTKEGYIYKDYNLYNKKPYFKENKTMSVIGSSFLSQPKYYDGSMEFFIVNDSKTLLSYYKNYKLIDKIEFENKTITKILYDNKVLAAYDGKMLSQIGIEKDKLIKKYRPLGHPNVKEWSIRADDINECILSTDTSFVLVYNGKSFYRFDLWFETRTVETVNMVSKVNSVSKGSDFHLVGCDDGLYLMRNFKPELVKVADMKLDTIGNSEYLFMDSEFCIAGARIGEAYKIVGIRNHTVDEFNNHSKRPSFPDILNFDDLPEGTFAVGLAYVNFDLRVYAFTATGYYRSEVIYHDSHMEELMKDIPSKK